MPHHSHPASKATLGATGKVLQVDVGAGGMVVFLSEEAPDMVATVIRVE
ncbi:MAG: hypothetical protein ACO3ZW_03135 [Opitutales bacterium]